MRDRAWYDAEAALPMTPKLNPNSIASPYDMITLRSVVTLVQSPEITQSLTPTGGAIIVVEAPINVNVKVVDPSPFITRMISYGVASCAVGIPTYVAFVIGIAW